MDSLYPVFFWPSTQSFSDRDSDKAITEEQFTEKA